MNLKPLYGKIWSPVFLQIDLKDATINIVDGSTPTPNEIEIKIGEGNLTYTESRNIDYTLNKGALDEVREGDEIPMDLTFDFVWEFIKGTTGTFGVPSVEDALKNIGAAAAWISSDTDVCRPYAVDVVLTHKPDCVGSDLEITTFTDFRYEELAHDLREGTISCSGRCNVTQAASARGPQT